MNPDILRYDLKPPHLFPEWERRSLFFVGGCCCVGFVPGQDLLLAESANGMGLIDLIAGKWIARDADFHSSPEQARSLVAPGFDILEGQLILMAGIWGGGLRKTTADGFMLDAQAPNWPYERIVMTRRWVGPKPPRVLVADDLVTTLVAYGFSDTGQSFIIATSSDLTTFVRAVIE